jgi:predicted nucleic acid-binding protein
VFHFTAHPSLGVNSTELIDRIQQRDLIAFVSTPVLTEVAHRLMLIEASAAQGWPLAGALKRLQRSPTVFRVLTQFRLSLAELLQKGVQVLAVTPQDVLTAASISQQAGLLSNDALIVAVMQAHGLTKLASHASDFDRIPRITRYTPV